MRNRSDGLFGRTAPERVQQIVDHHDPRVAGERPREPDQHPLPVRQLAPPPTRALPRPDPLERLRRLALGLSAPAPCKANGHPTNFETSTFNPGPSRSSHTISCPSRRLRARSRRSVNTWLPSDTLPLSGRSIPAAIFSSVVLPASRDPTTATTSPGPTSNETSSSTSVHCPPREYPLQTRSTDNSSATINRPRQQRFRRGALPVHRPDARSRMDIKPHSFASSLLWMPRSLVGQSTGFPRARLSRCSVCTLSCAPCRKRPCTPAPLHGRSGQARRDPRAPRAPACTAARRGPPEAAPCCAATHGRSRPPRASPRSDRAWPFDAPLDQAQIAFLRQARQSVIRRALGEAAPRRTGQPDDVRHPTPCPAAGSRDPGRSSAGWYRPR